MSNHRSLDFIPPLAGEVIPTPDGDGLVKAVWTYSDMSGMRDKDFDDKLRARIGQNYHRKYFRVVVKLKESGDLKEYDSWEIKSEGWTPDRDIERSWRDFGE